MSEQRKPASLKKVTVTPSFTMKRKYQPEMSDLCSKDRGHMKTTLEFKDLCDNVIDMILCELQLDDLAIISDTCTRLRGIAGSVFSRRHAHRLISIDAFYYEPSLSNSMVYCKHGAIVRISDIIVWFKLLRNFGASIKYLRIQNSDFKIGIFIALRNLNKYISEFCSDSLEILEIDRSPSFTLTKTMTKLQELYFCTEHFENSEALELMPNLRTLKLFRIPKAMAKNYEKLERVDLILDTDDEVETFISFVRLNRQIKYLSVCLSFNCSPEHNISIYSSIADHLTQLTTLKLHELNDEPDVYSRHRFKTVETFLISYGHSRHIFEFDHLKKVTLWGSNTAAPYCINFALRNKKLKILKLDELDEMLLDRGVIRNLLSELPELEEIIVHSRDRNRYSILKNLLGREWEQYEKEKTGRLKPSRAPRFQRFRKINSTPK